MPVRMHGDEITLHVSLPRFESFKDMHQIRILSVCTTCAAKAADNTYSSKSPVYFKSSSEATALPLSWCQSGIVRRPGLAYVSLGKDLCCSLTGPVCLVTDSQALASILMAGMPCRSKTPLATLVYMKTVSAAASCPRTSKQKRPAKLAAT